MGRDFTAGDPGVVELDGSGMTLAVACARWNRVITDRLLEGFVQRATTLGVDADAIDVAWVPGAYELPLTASALARTGRYDAVVAIGAVIRGDTPHFDFVAGGVADGLMRVQLDTGVPVVFGVLTTENRRQALVRSAVRGDVVGDDKGAESADVAIEMVTVLRSINRG